jgi:putative acyl-CoA dehydrogenase
MGATHVVANQPPPLEGYDAFASDKWLAPCVQRASVEWISKAASDLGRYVGSAEAQALAADANRNPPVLRSFDRYGHRIDAVEYHPSYHALMTRACGAGVHSTAWTAKQGGFSARAALFYLWNQLEQGTACPVTMTFASIPVFRHAPVLAKAWDPKVTAASYDPRALPIAQKTGATVGMAMTEKQGGSDLRAIQTTAQPGDGAYVLTGHKWFCSAPMSDSFFTLAKLPEGVTCFLVPRSHEDGTRNAFLIQRLKDKCGNRSNASAEIEYDGTRAFLVGEPGRGIATLIEMAHHTRFDIVVGVAGMMRSALDHALHHAMHREAFGKRVADHPLMANVLADLSLEAQAAQLLAFRLAAAFDASAADPRERALQRVLTPIAKYWLCKRVPPMVVEAMECLGGNGYVEEAPLARLYREAPLNGIWEGSGNVICLDVLRSLVKSPQVLDALAHEAQAGGAQAMAKFEEARTQLQDGPHAETAARRVVESIAVAMQASLMQRYSSGASADAFVASRCGPDTWRALGTLAPGVDCGAILAGARRDR